MKPIQEQTLGEIIKNAANNRLGSSLGWLAAILSSLAAALGVTPLRLAIGDDFSAKHGRLMPDLQKLANHMNLLLHLMDKCAGIDTDIASATAGGNRALIDVTGQRQKVVITEIIELCLTVEKLAIKLQNEIRPEDETKMHAAIEIAKAGYWIAKWESDLMIYGE